MKDEQTPIEGSATAVESPRRELELRHPPSGPAPSTLWRTDDPEEVVKRATKAADALAPVLREKGMITSLGRDREHVNIEGWQTLASMVGLVSARPWTREIPWPADERLTEQLRGLRDSGYAFGYDAGYAAQTLDGREVGGGEGTCKRTEDKWRTRPVYENGSKVGEQAVDDYALKGMALTRAQSRAFASPLRFVVELAGFSGMPAEEVDSGAGPARGSGQRSSSASPKEPSQAQLNLIKKCVKEQGADEKEAQLIRRFAKARLTPGKTGTASNAIGKLTSDEEGVAKAAARALWQMANEWQGTDPATKPNEGPGASDVPADTEDLEQTKLEPESEGEK